MAIKTTWRSSIGNIVEEKCKSRPGRRLQLESTIPCSCAAGKIMIVSDHPKFICFQPWKVASTTLYARLGKYDSGRYPQNKYFNEHLGEWTHKHLALDAFFSLPESSEQYFRFCFVRNPYDRIYSGFLQRRHRLTHDHAYLQSSPKHAAELNAIKHGFGDFLDLMQKRYEKTGMVSGRALYDHVYFDDMATLDFIGYVEYFEKCLLQVCQKLNIEILDQVNGNVRYTPSRTQLSIEQPRYRYIQQFGRQDIEIVNNIYDKDFEPLGYQRLDPLVVDDEPFRLKKLSPFGDNKGPLVPAQAVRNSALQPVSR